MSRTTFRPGDWVATDIGGIGIPDGHVARAVSVANGAAFIDPPHPLANFPGRPFEWPLHWLRPAQNPTQTLCTGYHPGGPARPLADQCAVCPSLANPHAANPRAAVPPLAWGHCDGRV